MSAYRFIPVGAPLRFGDEYYSHSYQTWIPMFTISPGSRATSSEKYRRLVTYAIVALGSPLLPGDECFSMRSYEWVPTHPDTPYAVNGVYRRLKPAVCESLTPSNTPMKTCILDGEEHPADEMTEYAGFGLVWEGNETQFRDQYQECSVRETWHYRGDMVTTNDGSLICQEEFDDNWFRCADSSEVYEKKFEVEVFNRSGRAMLVHESVREADFQYCNHYDAYYHVEGGKDINDWTGTEGSWVSARAIRNGPFFLCSDCGEYYHNDDRNTVNSVRILCDTCYDDRDPDDDDADESIIQSYDSTNYPPAIGDPKERLYGVENEVEVVSQSGAEKTSISKKVAKVLGKDFAILKGDGSLNYGFEIVTAPATMKIHAERWRKLCTPGEGDPRKGLRSARTKTCGLHIHVSRVDFKSPLMLGRVQVFINEPSHRNFIEGIARRNETDWCGFSKKKLDSGTQDGRRRTAVGDKYVAVNCLHSKTIEFRMFKGTLTYGHFMSSLQFIDALLDFTLPGNIGLSDLTVAKFCAFVKNQRKHWPHLTNELVRLGFLPKEAKVKVELLDKDGNVISESVSDDESLEVAQSSVTPSSVYAGHLATDGVGLLGIDPTVRTKVEPRSIFSTPPPWSTFEIRADEPVIHSSALASPFAGRRGEQPPTGPELEQMIRIPADSIIEDGDWVCHVDDVANGLWVESSIGRPLNTQFDSIQVGYRYSEMLHQLRANPDYNPFVGNRSSEPGPTPEQLDFMRPLSCGEVINDGDWLRSMAEWADGLVGIEVGANGGDTQDILRFDPRLVWAAAAVPQQTATVAVDTETCADFDHIPLAS